jgi:hypothetical protein
MRVGNKLARLKKLFDLAHFALRGDRQALRASPEFGSNDEFQIQVTPDRFGRSFYRQALSSLNSGSDCQVFQEGSLSNSGSFVPAICVTRFRRACPDSKECGFNGALPTSRLSTFAIRSCGRGDQGRALTGRGLWADVCVLRTLSWAGLFMPHSRRLHHGETHERASMVPGRREVPFHDGLLPGCFSSPLFGLRLVGYLNRQPFPRHQCSGSDRVHDRRNKG